MCELFGMSSRLPTNVTFSLSVLGERGGRLGPHKDGWGIAFNEMNDFRIIKEAAPAANSARLQFIEGHDFKSQIVISHIRRATAPTVASFTNTHPFARELYGFTHVFAHNGDVPGVLQDGRFGPRYYYPQGETDSERAFCALTDRLRDGLTPASVMQFEKKSPSSKNGLLRFRSSAFSISFWPIPSISMRTAQPTSFTYCESAFRKQNASRARS